MSFQHEKIACERLDFAGQRWCKLKIAPQRMRSRRIRRIVPIAGLCPNYSTIRRGNGAIVE